MLVIGADIRELDAEGSGELARLSGESAGLSGAEGEHLDAGLLHHLAQSGLVRQLVPLDVAARRQPAAELGVPM